LVPTINLLTSEGRTIFGKPEQEFSVPPTFEALGISHWLVLYETDITFNENLRNSSLYAKTKDRALVYVNNLLSGTLNRMGESYTLPLTIEKDTHLQLLVENMGRMTSGHYDFEDFKVVDLLT
jgi:hypothetical protein